jgi:hypothetical protein
MGWSHSIALISQYLYSMGWYRTTRRFPGRHRVLDLRDARWDCDQQPISAGAPFMSNPLGKVVSLPAVEQYLSVATTAWNAVKPDVVSWWKIWQTTNISSMSTGTQFLLLALDDLMLLVDQIINSGADKKATVLSAIGTLYDCVITPFLPPVLKPFSGAIRQLIIFCLLSVLIDFCISKYRNGSWSTVTPSPSPVSSAVKFALQYHR